ATDGRAVRMVKDVRSVRCRAVAKCPLRKRSRLRFRRTAVLGGGLTGPAGSWFAAVSQRASVRGAGDRLRRHRVFFRMQERRAGQETRRRLSVYGIAARMTGGVVRWETAARTAQPGF